jgi:polyisoprenyl-teichoic acid--peptidoglycan teichoic acid transferase
MSAVPPSDQPAFRHAREPVRNRRTTRQRILLGLGVLVVLGIVGGLSVLGYGWYRWNQIEQKDLALAESVGGPQNFLIVGSDSRDSVSDEDANADAFLDEPGAAELGQRADTIMVARIDPGSKSVDLISFPRDLWIPIQPSGEEQRINTAYGVGGAQAIIDTIRTEFGIDINHYVEINFGSFKGVVDAVGGVPMYFDSPMRDENTGLYQYELGCVNLDGEQGLAFARARHLEYQDARQRWVDDPTGDLGRIDRQQLFIRKVLDRSQARFGSLDVRAINDIISSTADNLTVDSGFNLGEMVELARAFQGFGGDQIVTHTLPVTPYMTNGGASVVGLDEVAAEEIFNVFRGLPPGTVSPGSVTVAVSNGSGAEMQATEVADELEGLGYQSSVSADATQTRTRTVVRYAPGMERHADQVARQLANGAELQEDTSLEGEDVPVVLVTGTDFTAVLAEATPPTASTTASTDTTTASSETTDPELVDEPIGIVPNEAPAGQECR